MARNVPWTRDIEVDGTHVIEGDYFRDHVTEHTLMEWCAILGRTEPSVKERAHRQGLKYKAERPSPPPISTQSEQKPACYAGISADAVIKLLRQKPCTLSELSSTFDRSEQTVQAAIAAMCADGYAIACQEQQVELAPLANPVTLPATLADQKQSTICLAVASDLHGGSKCAQWTNLRAFVIEAYEKYGVRQILVPGDIVAGKEVYPGQVQDLYAIGAEDQAEDALVNIPAMPGLRWYVMGGNHDESYYKLAGLNVVEYICRQRDDLTYVGSNFAQLSLTRSVDVAMWHGSGGVPYALSYRGQRFLPQLMADEMEKLVLGVNPSPRIRVVLAGHLHTGMYFWQGVIEYFQCPCFEGRNSLFKRKGWKPDIGGWVIEIGLTESNLVHVINAHALKYVEIEEDYRNHQHLVKREAIKIEPLFSLMDQ